MAENKPSTPEQQLLKLIEESARTGKDAAAAPPAKPKAPGFSLEKAMDQAVGKFLGKLSFLKRGGQRSLAKRRRMPSDIATVNRVMLLGVIAMAAYVIFDLSASATSLRRPPNFVPPKDMSVPFAKETIEPLKEASYYLQKASSRNIFKEGRPQEVQQEKGGSTVADEGAAVIQGLSLVGISWSSSPDAIIEDKARQRTFFVKRGQMVGDSVKVEAIFKDHVVLLYEDKEFELR